MLDDVGIRLDDVGWCWDGVGWCWMMLGWCWDDVGMMLDDVGVMLDDVGMMFGWCWGDVGMMLGWCWDNVGWCWDDVRWCWMMLDDGGWCWDGVRWYWQILGIWSCLKMGKITVFNGKHSHQQFYSLWLSPGRTHSMQNGDSSCSSIGESLAANQTRLGKSTVLFDEFPSFQPPWNLIHPIKPHEIALHEKSR